MPTNFGGVQDIADYLTDGFWEDGGDSRRSFDTSSSTTILVYLDNLDSDTREVALAALAAWEMVADINFVESSDWDNTQIDFYTSDSSTSSDDIAAYSSTSLIGTSEIWFSSVVITTAWMDYFGSDMGGYGFQTYVHEIGHALGLGHPGDYNGTGTYETEAEFVYDSWQTTIMSYFSQEDNTAINATEAYLFGPMAADILAIQELYGAPTSGSATSGDTVWGSNTNIDNPIGAFLEELASGISTPDPVAYTIYDVDGTDTLDLSAIGRPLVFNLNGGTYSDVGALIGVLSIAVGTVIENLISGEDSDDITGNAAANTIYGNGGDDIIDGGAGADTIYGGAGADTIEGGTAFDTIYGNDGADNIVGGIGADSVYGGDGNDTIYTNTGEDYVGGGEGNDRISSGDGRDTVRGGGGDDFIEGRNGFDTLYGQDGDDEVWGNIGADRIYGGNGDDYLRGGSGEDSIYGEADDDILYGNKGSDHLSGGTGDDRLYGGSGDDSLLGGDGDDWISGSQGVDRITGGAGNDTLLGGSLRDVFIFDLGHDRDVIEGFETKDDVQLSSDLVDGLTSVADVLSTFGTTVNGDVALDFGAGDRIVFDGITDLATIEDSLIIV